MLVYWIWFAQLPGLSNQDRLTLLSHFRSPEDLYFSKGLPIPGLRVKTARALADRDLSAAEKILADCRRERLQIVTFQDAAYPARLKNISDPPMLLYYKGRLPDFNSRPVIGIVGTRKASAYGLQTAYKLGYQIGKCGAVVVSGMASGIDAMAVTGALTAGQTTVGVLGSGVDVVYPKSNRRLFQDVEEYGCLLSEFPPGMPPYGSNFPKRNRIISGLSNGVLVVEAPEGSGALITAERALDQGRDVFAVPGNVDQPGFAGSNRLLREGAILAASGWDVLCEYASQYPDMLHREDGLPPVQTEKKMPKVPQPAQNPEKMTLLKETLEKKPIDKNPSAPYSDVNAITQKLSGWEKDIVLALGSQTRLIEDVIDETGIPANRFMTSLTVLEVQGIVKRLSGKRITLI